MVWNLLAGRGHYRELEKRNYSHQYRQRGHYSIKACKILGFGNSVNPTHFERRIFSDRVSGIFQQLPYPPGKKPEDQNEQHERIQAGVSY